VFYDDNHWQHSSDRDTKSNSKNDQERENMILIEKKGTF